MGTDLATLGESELAKWRNAHVGYIFQTFNLIPVLTAFENVELPLLLTSLSKSDRKRNVETALELVGLSDRMNHRPKQLSGGQEQRVAIARAIVVDPDFILADEPTGNLDARSGEEVLNILSTLNKKLNKTIVMVTHDPHATSLRHTNVTWKRVSFWASAKSSPHLIVESCGCSRYIRPMSVLPIRLDFARVPPIKCQGIKTKLVPFILGSIRWPEEATGRWIEPFLGSGVVAFNVAPEIALLADTNTHIIGLYRAIQKGEVDARNVREFLFCEGEKLERIGEDYYYEVRERFNRESSPYDFIFLNRSCFNGVMRFNRNGGFNVPFCKKPGRFTQSYITKIVNQIDWAAKQMSGKDWEFRVAHWRETLLLAKTDDFVYLDPPYIGRHTDYFNSWDEREAIDLAETVKALPCGFAFSMWMQNRFRRNDHIDEYWKGSDIRTQSHFYHVGSTEELRNAMDEALVIKSGFASDNQ